MEGRVMGIYIKGFKPQDGLYVIKDGVIRKYKGNGGTVRPYELVEVKEPHGRLIDADAFTEFLKDAIKQQKYEDTKIDGLLTVADVIEAVISELDGTSLVGFKNAPTIEPEPHWIPCSERLPRKEEQDDDLGVLVTLGNGYSGIECDWYYGDHWYCWDGFVVAWMPLPKPWKGDK